jgi:hypothetical protein
MGKAHGTYDIEAWESVSKAITTRMNKEKQLNDELAKCKILKVSSQLVSVTLLSIANIKNVKDINNIWSVLKEKAFQLLQCAISQEETKEIDQEL